MTAKLNKPILVIGVGLSLVLWLWDSLHQEIISLGEWSFFVLLALGAVFWLLSRQPSVLHVSPVAPLKREMVEAAIAQAERVCADIEKEAPNKDISILKQEIANLPAKFNREQLQIGITGGKKVGKTSLKQVLNPDKIAPNVSLVETPALFTETEVTESIAREVALNSDLVLFLITGDLTESQWQLLQHYQKNYQRFLLLFNKQDQYPPEERVVILAQLKQRLHSIISEEDIIPISVAPNDIKVRQYQEDGTQAEWIEKQTANLSNLETRLQQIIAQESSSLVWATIWRQALNFRQQGKDILNGIRRDRSLPIIDKYQWIAAAAAFANPVSTLDLLATIAVNSQMIVDLSEIYQQSFSLKQAQAVAGTLGKLMVKLGLVELSSQAISGLLKSNTITYIAGGIVQGLSAAYLTRLAGLSLMEYFADQEVSLTGKETVNIDNLGQKIKEVFQENQRGAILQDFVKQAVSKMAFKIS